jgi:hypothetical protein
MAGSVSTLVAYFKRSETDDEGRSRVLRQLGERGERERFSPVVVEYRVLAAVSEFPRRALIRYERRPT